MRVHSTAKPVRWKRLLPTDPNERYDVVIASYVLSELANDNERIERYNIWFHSSQVESTYLRFFQIIGLIHYGSTQREEE